MKKSLWIKAGLASAILAFSTPVSAFAGNKPHTQTLIVSSQILNDEGKMIDPESDAKENGDPFTITVHFSHLQENDEIEYTYGNIRPDKDGTAKVTYISGNCTPHYFDQVPVTARIVVSEDAGGYQASYQTMDFVQNVEDATKEAHQTLTTQELQLKDGKDGFVLFSNQKPEKVPETVTAQRKAPVTGLLILVFLITGILVYGLHRRRSEK